MQQRRWDAWLFKCNPDVFPIDDVIRQTGIDHIGSWSLGTNFRQVAIGDPFAMWISGPQHMGIYMTGVVVEDPYTYSGPVSWGDPALRNRERWYVDMEVDHPIVQDPITLAQLRSEPALARVATVLGTRVASPIGLTDEEWSAIDSMAGSRPWSNQYR